MTILRYHRVLASISAGTALTLVLSSCAVFSARKEETIPRAPERPVASSSYSPYSRYTKPEMPTCPEPGKFNPAEATSSATASASVSPRAAPSASGGEVRTVGLTDDNKAGKPRPRSQGGTSKYVTVHDDGSWKYSPDKDRELTVNADGTWSYRSDGYRHQEVTLHADGSWDAVENSKSTQEKTHVNPDGSWDTVTKYEAEEGKEAVEAREQVRPDGSWEKKGRYQTIIGSADGTVTITDSKNGQQSTSVSSAWGLVKPFDYERSSIVQRTEDIKYGVGSNGVIPLIPRTPLPRGVKAVQAPVGSEQERIAIAQQQRLVLTDDNKAGKEPRRRETEPHDWGLDNVDLKDDGSYSYSTKGGKETAEVAADGTWKSKNSDGDTTTLNADGSWDSYTEKTKVNMHVNPNGTWVKKTGESAKIQMFADGSWCYEYKDSEITYGTPDGKIYEGVSDKKWREVAQKTWENRSSDKSIKDPETPLAPLTVKDGVIPLRARNPIAAGQKAFP